MATEKLSVTFREGEALPEDEGSLDHIEETSNGGVQVNPDLEPESGDELILGKFKSQDELVKAYTELQTKLSSRPKEETPAGDDDDEAAPAPATDTSLRLTEQETKAAEAKGIDFDALAVEFTREGKLSDKAYADLEKAGYNRQTADRFLRGVQAEAASIRTRIAEVVGGEENLPVVIEWAKANLSAEEKAFFDSSLEQSESAARLAMRGIFAQYVAANGQPPKLIDTESRATNSGVQPFESMDDYVAAISDPRYDRSPKYRKQVDARIAITDM